MRFILDNVRTVPILQRWAAGPCSVLSFFIYKPAGQKLQKNCVGLARALLYQIMKANPELISLVEAAIDPHEGEYMQSWTFQRTKSYLMAALERLTQKTHCCLFVDGLDELEDDFITVRAQTINCMYSEN